MFKKTASILALSLCYTLGIQSQPADAVPIEWQKEVPEIVHPDRQLVHLYNKTWEIAAGRVRKGPKGIVASPYLDENCYDSQIWIWDACFMVMFSKYAPAVYPGKQTLNNFYVPIHENRPTPLRIHLRDNPPLFAWVEYMNYQFTGDKAHIKEVLLEKQYLQKHFTYFDTISHGNRNPAISPNPIFKETIRDAKGALRGFTWTGGACGMDNTPRGREAGGYDKILWIDAISQQALSALYISRLYAELGEKKMSRQWKKTYQQLKKEINDKYWDEEDGLYYDIAIADGKCCKIKTPASFWPMLAEIPSSRQAERMKKYLLSEKYMGGKYPWVSLSRDDRDYNNATGDYWRGGIWLPMAYMGTKALEKYGMNDLADKLAERVVLQQLRTYNAVEPHTIWECYSPSQDIPSTEYGNRARPDFCGWSALGPISLLIENIMGFRKADALTRTLQWDLKPQIGTYGVRNFKFGDIRTDLVYHPEKHQIEAHSNLPFRLIVNGKSHKVKEGEQWIKIKSDR